MTETSLWLSDAQFARLSPLLACDTRGVPRVDDRRVISGILHVLRSGRRRKGAPACYGPRKTLYDRFVRRAAKGVWEKLFLALSEGGGPPSALRIDATHVKAHRSAAGGEGGARRRRSDGPEADEPPRSMRPSTKAAGPGA